MIVRHVATYTQQATIRIDRDLKIPELVALHRGGGEMFAPVLNPFDRASQQYRGDGYYDFFLIEDEFRAEPAANIGRDNANAVFRQIQKLDQDGLRAVRHLGRRPHGQPSVVVAQAGSNAPAFNGVAQALVLMQGFPKHVRSISKRRIGIAVGQGEAGDQVVGQRAVSLGCAVG